MSSETDAVVVTATGRAPAGEAEFISEYSEAEKRRTTAVAAFGFRDPVSLTRASATVGTRYIPAAHSMPTYRTRAAPTMTTATIIATRHQSSILCIDPISVEADGSG